MAARHVKVQECLTRLPSSTLQTVTYPPYPDLVQEVGRKLLIKILKLAKLGPRLSNYDPSAPDSASNSLVL